MRRWTSRGRRIGWSVTALFAAVTATLVAVAVADDGSNNDTVTAGAGLSPSGGVTTTTTTSTSTTTTTTTTTTLPPSTTSTTTTEPPTTTPPPTAAPATTAAPAPAPAPAPPPPPPPPTTEAPPPAGPAVKCVVRLHGKGGSGQGAGQDSLGYTEVAPQGNAANPGGGWYWLYFPEGSYSAARSAVGAAIQSNGCTRVVVDGFSNGGAFAAKLYCRGETFGGRVVGYIADDPVVDHGADGCAPARGVHMRLYWTGVLEGVDYHYPCSSNGWICEGDETIGVDAFAANLGIGWTHSPNGCHCSIDQPPELSAWLQ